MIAGDEFSLILSNQDVFCYGKDKLGRLGLGPDIETIEKP
jgi:hypothetical protein